MKIEVEVMSSGTTKPSTPTPHHCRHYQLSFLDQLAPPCFLPMVLFFPKQALYNKDLAGEGCLDRVKKSLSDALSLFYPLAGRIVNNNKDLCMIDCNDEGAYFVEARAKCQLSDVLRDPNPNDMNKFLAVEIADAIVNELPIAVQVTFFDCNGITISLCMNHKIVDGLSFFTFLNTWSAIARGEKNIAAPLFGAANIFPPRDLHGFPTNVGIVNDKIVTKRFVFDEAKISVLRKKYTDGKTRPTRVEALSTFLWHRLVVSTKPREELSGRICTMIQAVNLRPRTSPPLPGNYFGNVSRFTVALPSWDPRADGSYSIVSQVRDSIQKIDTEYVKKLQAQEESEGHMSFLNQLLELYKSGRLVSFNFTSLCGFPIYEADFGWGKPAFIGSASLTYKNLVTLLDTKSGNGIEAWIHMEEQDMARFEADEELPAFASPTTLEIKESVAKNVVVLRDIMSKL